MPDTRPATAANPPHTMIRSRRLRARLSCFSVQLCGIAMNFPKASGTRPETGITNMAHPRRAGCFESEGPCCSFEAGKAAKKKRAARAAVKVVECYPHGRNGRSVRVLS
jgi:hypothetical protein